MASEAGRAAARQAAWAALKAQHLTNQDVADRAGIDPATVSDFINGRRWPRAGNLSKIEAALGLTPGTLAGLGEDAPAGAARPDLSALGDPELVAELTYRLEALRRENVELTARLEDARAQLDELTADGRGKPTQKSGPPASEPDSVQGGELVEFRPTTPRTRAARNAPSRGKQLKAEADAAGEESQDPNDHDQI